MSHISFLKGVSLLSFSSPPLALLALAAALLALLWATRRPAGPVLPAVRCGVFTVKSAFVTWGFLSKATVRQWLCNLAKA